MSTKSKTSAALQGGLAGAGTGAAIGSVVPVIGTGIGAVAGGAIGAAAGLFADSADEEELENDPEYQAAKRRERTMKRMSEALGRAFAAAKPKTAGAAMSRAVVPQGGANVV